MVSHSLTPALMRKPASAVLIESRLSPVVSCPPGLRRRDDLDVAAAPGDE
ncbi:MAG: hypothetical protein K0S49_554, partial [Microbacterium sp.]|nr:hypothetical protein [Microbacterium sp.]